MARKGIGLMFLTYGANLWYLAGFHRRRAELTDSNTYGDYVIGAYIGADGRIVLVAPRMGGSFYQQEAADKPWISEVRILDESESPRDVMAQVVKSFQVGEDGFQSMTGLGLIRVSCSRRFYLAAHSQLLRRSWLLCA